MKSSNKKNTNFIKTNSSFNIKLKANNNHHKKLKLDNIYLNSEKFYNNTAKENQRNKENIYTKNRYDTEENIKYYNTEINKGYNQPSTETNTPYSQKKVYENNQMKNQLSQRFLVPSKEYKLRKTLITTNKRDNKRNNNIRGDFIINENYGININKIKIINNSNTNIYGNNNFSFIINDIKNIKNSINKKNNNNDSFIDNNKKSTTTNNDLSNEQINYIYKSNLINTIDNSDYKNDQKAYNIVNINNNINNNYIDSIRNNTNNKNNIKNKSNKIININKVRNSATNIFINVKTPINNKFKKEENSKNIKIKSIYNIIFYSINGFNNNQRKTNINHNNKMNNILKSYNSIDNEYINNFNYIYKNNLKKDNNNKMNNNNSSNYINTTLNSHRIRKQNNINLINSFNNSNIENNTNNKRNVNKIKISNQPLTSYKEIKDRLKKFHKKKLLDESHQFYKNGSYFSCKLIKNNDSNIRENSCQLLESRIRSRRDKFILQYKAPDGNKIYERMTNTPEYSESKRFLLNKDEIKNYQSASNINFLSIFISNNQKNLVPQKSEDILKCLTERKNIKTKPESLSLNNIFSKSNINFDKNNKQLKNNICQSSKNNNKYYNFRNKCINIGDGRLERKNRNVNTGSHSIKINDSKIFQTLNNKLDKTPDHNSKINVYSYKILNQNESSKQLKQRNHSQKNNIRIKTINTIDSTNKINNIQTINDNKETNHKMNEKIIINNIYNNILYRSIRITSINKKKKNKKQELLKELNKCINIGKNILNKIPKKECDICHKYIDSHLFKIHYNSHPTEIFNWLYLGTFSNACDIKELRRMKINYILNVANECINKKLPKDIKELHLKIKDFDGFEVYNYFDEANEYINKCKTEGSRLLVHCKLGISRSASFIIAYLIKYNNMSVEEALEFVKQKRNQVKPNEGFINQLHEYEKENKK